MVVSDYTTEKEVYTLKNDDLLIKFTNCKYIENDDGFDFYYEGTKIAFVEKDYLDKEERQKLREIQSN